MHKLSFGGGFIGLVFAAGSALIFVLGFPTLWYFVAFAFGLGVGIALFLRILNRRISQRNRPLSILTAPREDRPLVFPRSAKIPDRFHVQAPTIA